jgi:hypothetical protein
MGEYSSTLNNTVQYLTLPNLSGCGNVCVYGTPAYYNNTVYIAVNSGPLLALPLSNGEFENSSSNIATASSSSSESYAFPSPTASISAPPGSGSGLIWVLDTSANGTAGLQLGPAILRAYTSNSLGAAIYSSSSNASDAGGNAIKFAVPVVANGHVYVGGSRQLTVYGLLH